MTTISIAIADDEALFRKGMTLILNSHDHLQVVMEAEHGKDLLDQLAEKEELPNVLLLDLKMPRMNGIEVAKVIRDRYSEIKVIVISTHFSRAFVINMIELGAAAYLPKNSEPEEVISTIQSVFANGFHYNNEVMAIIRENMTSKTKPKAQFPFELTAREKEILELICKEYTTPEIANTLFISPRTVDGHRNNLLSKLNCKNVAGLVVFALQHEIVKLDNKF